MTGKKIKPPCDLMKEMPLREEEGYCLSRVAFSSCRVEIKGTEISETEALYWFGIWIRNVALLWRSEQGRYMERLL
jgi:hypothetical protein